MKPSDYDEKLPQSDSIETKYAKRAAIASKAVVDLLQSQLLANVAVTIDSEKIASDEPYSYLISVRDSENVVASKVIALNSLQLNDPIAATLEILRVTLSLAHNVKEILELRREENEQV